MAPQPEFRTNFAQLTEILTDADQDRSNRLLRLQGWRGDGLTCAVRAGNAHRIGPASCSALAVMTLATGSATLAAVTAGAAAIGAVATNHPIETTYNWWAERVGRAPIPPNRAAKRLACALGSLFFAASAVGYATEITLLAVIPALVMAVLAGFVAASKVCVPSMLFTLLFGADRATARHLGGSPDFAPPVTGTFVSTTKVPSVPD